MAERLERARAKPGDSGEALELERALAPRCPTRPAKGGDPKDHLEFCPHCHRDLVYPLDWAPVGQGRWRVVLRCPECEWHGRGIYSQGVVDRFDELLDEGSQALLEDLQLLARTNLESEIDRFVTALNAGHVLPEDF